MQVPPPELHCTPPAQVSTPVPVQVTRQIDPLQVTRCRHEFLPEQDTTLVPALVVIPPAQERAPLQVSVHSSPEQVTAEAQLASPSQVSWVVAALLLTVPLQALFPAHEMVHWLPPHLRAPAQASASPTPPQVILHEEASAQSTPLAQPEAPQVTWQGWRDGQVTASAHEPIAVQSNTHLPPW